MYSSNWKADTFFDKGSWLYTLVMTMIFFMENMYLEYNTMFLVKIKNTDKGLNDSLLCV